MLQRTGNLPKLAALLNIEECTESFRDAKKFLSSNVHWILGHTEELGIGCLLELIGSLKSIVSQFGEAQKWLSLLTAWYQQTKSYDESADGSDLGMPYEKHITTKILSDSCISNDTSCIEPVQNRCWQSGVRSFDCAVKSLDYVEEEKKAQTSLLEEDILPQSSLMTNTSEVGTIHEYPMKQVPVESCIVYQKRRRCLYECIEMNIDAVVKDCNFDEQYHLTLYLAAKLIFYVLEITTQGKKCQNTTIYQQQTWICSVENKEESCSLNKCASFNQEHCKSEEKQVCQNTQGKGVFVGQKKSLMCIKARSDEDIVKDGIISQDVGASVGDHKDEVDISNDSQALAVDDGRIKNLQERFVQKSSSNLDVNKPGQYCDDSVVRESQMAEFDSKNEDDLKGKNEELNTIEYSADSNEFQECRKAVEIGKRVSDVKSKTKKVNNEKTPKEKEHKVLQSSSMGSSKHAMTKLKNGTIPLVVLLLMLTQVESKTIPSISKDSTDLNILSYDLLITDLCSLSTLNRSQSCQLNENQLAYTIKFCGFQKLCKEGYKARCVNILQGGMAHICFPANLSSKEGFRRIAWIDKDNPSVVKVQVEQCPHGTYQPSKSNGFDACTTKHLDVTDIPKKYLLFRKGNSSAATYVYCNYKEGYFNLENKTLLNYDEDSAHDHHFCMHINDIRPNWFNCSDQKSLLPNGTCVSNCLPGECRDAHNDFVCKMHCSHSALESGDDDDDNNDDKAEQRSGETTTMESVTKVYKTQEPDDTDDKLTYTKNIMIVAICLSCAWLLVVAFIFVYSRYRHSSTTSIEAPPSSSDESIIKYTPSTSSVSIESETKPLHGRQQPTCDAKKTDIKTVFEAKVDTVNIYTYGNETGRVCQPLSKQDCVVDDERSDFGKDDRRSTNSVVVRDNSKEVPKTRSHKDSDPACQDDARTPLLGEDCEEEASSNQRHEPFGTCAVRTDAIDLQNSDEREKSCPRPTTKFENFKKDIDDANTQAVVNSLNNSMFSCGAFIYKNKVAGTVFRVGQYFIMTAFHVIRDIIKDPTGGTRFLFSKLENSDDVTVNFNESICDHSRRRFRLKYRFHDEALDVAVLEIIDIAELEDFPEGLLLWKYDISHVDVKKIHMIGYGHVDNPYEKHLETCEIVQDFQNRFREALASVKTHRQEYIDDLTNQGKDPSFVDLGYAHVDDPELIPFDCCMGKGLSGAPILKTEGNSSKVIGIVLGGKPDFFYQLSRENQLSFERRYLIEVGMKMQMIYESIASKDPTLAGQLFKGE